MKKCQQHRTSAWQGGKDTEVGTSVFDVPVRSRRSGIVHTQIYRSRAVNQSPEYLHAMQDTHGIAKRIGEIRFTEVGDRA